MPTTTPQLGMPRIAGVMMNRRAERSDKLMAWVLLAFVAALVPA